MAWTALTRTWADGGRAVLDIAARTIYTFHGNQPSPEGLNSLAGVRDTPRHRDLGSSWAHLRWQRGWALLSRTKQSSLTAGPDRTAGDPVYRLEPAWTVARGGRSWGRPCQRVVDGERAGPALTKLPRLPPGGAAGRRSNVAPAASFYGSAGIAGGTTKASVSPRLAREFAFGGPELVELVVTTRRSRLEQFPGNRSIRDPVAPPMPSLPGHLDEEVPKRPRCLQELEVPPRAVPPPLWPPRYFPWSRTSATPGRGH